MAALCRDLHKVTVAAQPQPFTKRLLGDSHAVDGGGVDKIPAQLRKGVQNGKGGIAGDSRTKGGSTKG